MHFVTPQSPRAPAKTTAAVKMPAVPIPAGRVGAVARMPSSPSTLASPPDVSPARVRTVPLPPVLAPRVSIAAAWQHIADLLRSRPHVAWAVVAAVAVSSLVAGVAVRRIAWEKTQNFRFVNGVSNAIEWGQYANSVGVTELYDRLVSEHGDEGEYKGPARFTLDYPPLRLLIASTWADWAVRNYPPTHPGEPIAWRAEYAFTRPMLRLNLACEVLASIGMFLLVYRWLRTCRIPPLLTETRASGWRLGSMYHLRQRPDEPDMTVDGLPSTVGLFPATASALLLWFNPAVIHNAHVIPQWDVWLLPAYTFAIYFGLRNWWLPAGIAVGICAMAKGQILFALPLLAAWPLLTGNIAGVLRLVVGLLAGVGMVTWPWLVRAEGSPEWMAYVLAAGVPLAIVGFVTPTPTVPPAARKLQSTRILLSLAVLAIVLWPVRSTGPGAMAMAAAVASAAILMAYFGRRRWLAVSLGTLLAGGLALTVPLFGASTSWYRVGTEYATRHWKHLFWGHAPNLGSILELKFGWRFADSLDVWPLLGPAWGDGVSVRHVMIGIYCVSLAVCVVAVVRHVRGRDPRLLLAIALPFLLAFAFLPQMIERYLIWPAALLSGFAAVNGLGLMMWLAVSLLASATMLEYSLHLARTSPEAVLLMPQLQRIFPNLGWVILAMAIAMLVMAVRRSKTPPADAPCLSRAA